MTSALIIRTIHKHNNISQTISLKGQTQTIKATPDTHYLITDSAGISPKNIKVKRHNNDLIISNTDDETSLVIEDYYTTDDTALIANVEGITQTYQPTAQLGDDIWTLHDSPKAMWWENVAGKALISGVLTGGLLTALKSNDSPSQHNTQTTPPTPTPPAPTPPTPSNQAPTDISLDNNTLTQGNQGVIIGTLSTHDPDTSDTHTYAVSDSRFEIAGTNLKLKDGVSIDTTTPLNITITSTDKGGLSTQKTFQLTINPAPTPPTPPTPANQAPTASDSHEQTQENQTLNRQLTATDPEGDPISYALTNNATHGNITINPDGSYHYTPNHGYYGTDSFGYTVSDDKGNSNTYTVNIDITSINEQAPQIAPYKKSTTNVYFHHVLADNNDNIIAVGSSNLGRFKQGLEPDLAFGGAKQITPGVISIVAQRNLNPNDYFQSIYQASLDKEGNIVMLGKLTNYDTGEEDISIEDTTLSIIRFKSDGTLDTNFNAQGVNAGILPTNIRTENLLNRHFFHLDSQGRILIRDDGGDLKRYHQDGTPDLSFNPTHTPGRIYVGNNYFITDNYDKIVTIKYNDNKIQLGRFNADGSPDTSFNSTSNTPSKIEIPIPTNPNQSFCEISYTLDKNNKIIVGVWGNNSTLVRLNEDGTLDTSFNPNGATPGILTETRIPAIITIKTDSQGRIIVVGDDRKSGQLDGQNDSVARYLADGSIDTSFGDNGLLRLDHAKKRGLTQCLNR